MIQNRVIPCLLLKDNGLVKTVKFKNPIYVGDPINTIKIFNDKEVDELAIIDISATKENKNPNFNLIKELASECFMPLAYGGGINSIDQIEKLFTIGIEKVILNSSAHFNPNLLKESISIFGSQSIVVSIDYRKQWLTNKVNCYTKQGTFNTKITPLDFALKMEKLGVGEIILGSIEKDGTMNGYDLEIINKVSSKINIPIVALGGAGSLQDFKDARLSGASGLAAGSFFIFQKSHRAVLITYPNQNEIKSIMS